MSRRLASLVFILGAALFSAAPVHAQADTSDTLQVSLTPSYPTPYSLASIAVSSTLIDLASTNITVLVNGRPYTHGSGNLNVGVPIGGPGSKTVVTVNAVNGGKTYTKQLVIRPGEVSLVVEPVSTSHPFYRGASQVAAEGRVRIIALADLRSSSNASIDPRSLVYTWKFGDQTLQEQSGIGHSVLDAIAPVQFRDADITLTVTTLDQSIVAQNSVNISPIDPVIRTYFNDPLLGPNFDIALPASISMSDAEDTFRAVAYFFGATPSLTWYVNGNASSHSKDITLRGSGTGTGSAVLTVEAKNAATFESGSATLSVTFGGKKKGFGIFGL